MSAIKIIQAFAKKSLTKDKGSGITSLPSQFMAESKAGEIAAVLQRAGIPINQLDDYIRSEKDLIKYLNIIEATSKPKYTVFSGQEAMDKLNKLFPKKGGDVNTYSKQYVDNLDKEIIDSGLYTKKEWANLSDELKEARRRKFDPNYDDAMEGMVESNVIPLPQKRTFKEEIEAMKKSGDIVDEDKMVISEKITDREMFKEANKKFNKPKTEAEIKTKLEKKNKENVAKINKRTMEEDREIENLYGSAGFGNDQKIDAEFLAEYLAENAGKVYDDLPTKERINFYGRAYDALTRYKKNVGRSVIDESQKGPGTPEFDGVNKDPEDFATGGRAGLYTGGMVDVEPSLSDIGHGSDALMARTRLISPGAQGTTSTGLNYLLAEDNDNIRVPFATGGGGRRAFLKLMAALGGTTAAFKTGILGLGEGAGKKAVTETIKKSAGSGQPPPYFFELMETITKNGREVKSYGERVRQTIAPSKDGKSELLLTEDLNTGSVQIKKIHKEGDDMVTKSEEMTYTKNMGDESTQGKPPDDYEEVTEFNSRIYKDEFNEPDFVDGIDVESIIKEVDVKKAEGGRINFNVGGLANVLARLGIKGSSRRFLEKAFGKEKFARMIENDPEMHRGLLEVVEMFRNRDKEGLKMYMQKFLPHMDDATVEEFIVGTTPDIEGLTGQLTRLGSGRDYAGKLEMMKKADQVKKLQNFDIKNVTKNAEGGRIELKGGGDALKAIINYFAKEAGKKGSQQLKDINPKALPSGIANIMGPEHLKMLRNNQTDYLESLLNIIKSDKKFLDQNKKLAETMMKDAPEGFEDQAQGIVKMMIEGSMGKGGRLDRLKVYDKIDIDDAIVDVEQMIKNRRVKESDGRALNASGGLQAMLGE